MTESTAIPQTFTTMEACMTLAAGTEDQFWAAQEKIGAVVAAQPGFEAVIGGPIANSRWMYFCGKFSTPDAMNDWYHSPKHKPVMNKAHSTWFDAFYIRKWRRPADGEALDGPLFCETAIVPDAALSDEVHAATVAGLTATLPTFNAPAFETAIGEFEEQPFQFVGPVEEFPQVAPVRYLLITHWDTEADLKAWLDSPSYAELAQLGEVTSQVSVLIRHAAQEREGLNADGSLRSWARAAV
ncbi:antibiotic biosynthesis monooxygenase family protein [Pseudonocardia sp. GCM10023141]|uniref:antibiotic biosynthesis monooxygenase family protein n=1 Tax=Pseudonocardia sp. GCM10023141 TaxID=3252653 RepID=UPI00360D34B9